MMKANKLTAFLLVLVMLTSLLSGFTVWAEDAAALTPDITWYTSEEAGAEYTINTAAQFLGLIQLIQSQKTFDGQTVKLGADIDLTGNVIAGKMASANSDLGPVAEGKNYASFGFMGTLDGQNHKVEGIVYDYYPGDPRIHDMGLFGAIAEGKTAIIKNIALYGDFKPITKTTTPWRSAGLYTLSRGTLICENVYNALNVSAAAHVGAFLSRTTSDTAVTRFTNCVVAGTVSANNNNTGGTLGGFVGSLGGEEATFENCAVIGTVNQTKIENAGGFVGKISAKKITFKNNIFAGEVYQVNALTGRYYAWSVDEANVNKESGNNLYIPCGNTSINTASPKLMPVVTVADDGTETVTFPEQTTPQYKVSASQMTGVAAAATLASYGMTDWVAIEEGTPLPATIATMLEADTIEFTKDTDHVADYYGYQTKVNGTVGSIRLVGHIDGVNYEKVGIKYTVKYIDSTEVSDLTDTKDTTTVYTGLSGATEQYLNTQQDMPYTGEYFFTVTLDEIQTDIGMVCVLIETFHVADGTEVAGDTYCVLVDWS